MEYGITGREGEKTITTHDRLTNSGAQDEAFLRKLSLLVVEDDTDTLDQISEFLQGKVGELITAGNGPEGLKKFEAHRPKIVLTDVFMPGMDGLDLAGKIRLLDRKVQIIVITAFERNEYLKRSIENGIDKYVLKPVHPERLETVLLECGHHLRGLEQLERQREREEEAKRVEAMGILAAGMAHDYNNLLNLILGWINVARDLAEPGSEISATLEKAVKISGKAQELGRRLMTFAQGDNTTVEQLPLAPVILEAVQGGLRDTSICTEFSLPPDLPPIPLVEPQLNWVFNQLAANASDAMPSGGIIKVTARLRPNLAMDDLPGSPGDFVHITFQDTGAGIAPEVLPKIFVPYFSTRKTYCEKGTGLGLAFCRTIIRDHRGLITAESPPGEGATFHIFLPTRREELGAGSSP